MNPAEAGEFRVFNQFTESFSVRDLAERTASVAGGEVTIDTVPDPACGKGRALLPRGDDQAARARAQAHLLEDATIEVLVETAKRYKDRVNFEAIRPTVNWRSTKSQVSVAGGAVGE